MVRVYLRLLRYLKPYKKGLAAALVCMVTLALTTGLYAYLVGPVLQFLLTGGQKGLAAVSRIVPHVDLSHLDKKEVLLILPVMVFLVALVKGVSYFGQFFFMGMTGQKVIVDLRRHLFRHLLGLSPGWFTADHSGDLISRFTNDVMQVQTAVTYAATSIVRDTLQIIVLLGVAFYLDWRLSVLAFGIIPATLYPIVRFARRLRKVTKQSNTVMGRITEIIHEVIGGIRVVQAFTMEPWENARFDAENDHFLSVMRRSFLVRGASTPTMEVMAVAGLSVTLWYATSAIGRGDLDPAKFLSFFATVMLMYQPVKSLGRLQNFIITGAASAERIFEILDTAPEIADAPGAVDLAPFAEALRFEDVRLVYGRAGGGGPGTEALQGIDLTIEKGKVLALVGPSGGGKSTLVNLIPRFYDPTAGTVRFDGHDLREVRLESLRRQVAVVSQDTIIFNDSVRANVTYGNPDVGDDAVWDALARAQATDFVAALPGGLDTRLGERGVTLSGGQRQRLAIARALCKDAPILVLDEATSNLDTENERAVQRALAELMAGRTVVVIAHRLSTIRDADRIVVLEGGRVAETGTHAALLARGGLYRRLHDLQLVGEGAAAGDAADGTGRAAEG